MSHVVDSKGISQGISWKAASVCTFSHRESCLHSKLLGITSSDVRSKSWKLMTLLNLQVHWGQITLAVWRIGELDHPQALGLNGLKLEA